MEQGQGLDVRRWEFAGPVAQAYETSRQPVIAIVGPTGGGKSTASAKRCLRVATWQDASPRDGVRRARIIVICPTYRRAWDTVMPSYFKVFPMTMGTFRGSRGDPADHIFDIVANVAGQRAQLHVEVLFRAVNDMDLEEFFRGLEATAFWYPEMDTNDSEAIISLGANRVGRYPEPDDRPDGGSGAYAGVFGDANAPMIGTWFHQRFYMQRRPGDRLFIQPGGYSVHAENMVNLRKIRPDYYAHMAQTLDAYDVGRLIENKPGYGRHGSPVHPNFKPDKHVSPRELDIMPYGDVYIGIDAGSNTLRPAAVFFQRTYVGQWRAMAEIHADRQRDTQEFASEIRWTLNRRFPNRKADQGAMGCVDPAAGGRNAMSEYSTAQALQNLTGIEMQLAPDNNPANRRSALNKPLLRDVPGNEPGLVIDPQCVGLIQGLSGGFHYPKRGPVIGLAPAKNDFSHVCEAAEYAPYTVDGLDANEGRFIRPGGEAADVAPVAIYDS